MFMNEGKSIVFFILVTGRQQVAEAPSLSLKIPSVSLAHAHKVISNVTTQQQSNIATRQRNQRERVCPIDWRSRVTVIPTSHVMCNPLFTRHMSLPFRQVQGFVNHSTANLENYYECVLGRCDNEKLWKMFFPRVNLVLLTKIRQFQKKKKFQ